MYSEQQRRDILDYLYDQMRIGRSMNSVCGKDTFNGKLVPPAKTIYEWIEEGKEAEGKRYARACEDRADFIFQEMMEISDRPAVMETKVHQQGTNGGFTQTIEADSHQHRRLQIDTRKWVLSRMNPKKYGDRVMTEDITEKPKTLVIKQAKK